MKLIFLSDHVAGGIGGEAPQGRWERHNDCGSFVQLLSAYFKLLLFLLPS